MSVLDYITAAAMVIAFFLALYFLLCRPLAHSLILRRNAHAYELAPPGTVLRPLTRDLQFVGSLFFGVFTGFGIAAIMLWRLDYQYFIELTIQAINLDPSLTLFQSGGIGVVITILPMSLWLGISSLWQLYKVKPQVHWIVPEKDDDPD